MIDLAFTPFDFDEEDAQTETRIFGSGDECMVVEFDPATGEVLRDAYAPDSTATAQEAADYLSPRIAAVHAALAGKRAERAAYLERIAARYDADINRLEKTLAWLMAGAGFREVLRDWASLALAGAKKRSISLGGITLGFKKKGPLIKIDRPDDALNYCRLVDPTAIKTTYEVQISRVCDALKSQWLAEPGSIPANSGFSYTPPSEAFEIK
jgi:hypothetical protein